MKNHVTLFFLLLGILVSGVSAFGQITITDADIEAVYLNSTWRTIDDSSTMMVDLGTSSSTTQTFDLSGLNLASTTADSENITYRPAAGQLLASEFPGAEIAMVQSQALQQGPYTFTITIAAYFSAEPSGAYALGFAIRNQITPVPPPGFPADTSYVQLFMPPSLGVPLPLTHNSAPRTATDTLTDPGGETDISTRTFTPAGYGTLMTPDGRNVQVIRMIIDQWETHIDEDQVVRHDPRTRTVEFRALDGTTLSVRVDTTYSSGTTQIKNYDYEYRTGTLAVNPVSSALPEAFRLAQNYPNPFNPTTMISFDLPSKESVSLKVYDLTGREVATLIDEELAPGSYEVPFTASALASGIYLYRFQAGARIETKMMSFVK